MNYYSNVIILSASHYGKAESFLVIENAQMFKNLSKIITSILADFRPITHCTWFSLQESRNWENLVRTMIISVENIDICSYTDNQDEAKLELEEEEDFIRHNETKDLSRKKKIMMQNTKKMRGRRRRRKRRGRMKKAERKRKKKMKKTTLIESEPIFCFFLACVWHSFWVRVSWIVNEIDMTFPLWIHFTFINSEQVKRDTILSQNRIQKLCPVGIEGDQKGKFSLFLFVVLNLVLFLNSAKNIDNGFYWFEIWNQHFDEIWK